MEFISFCVCMYVGISFWLVKIGAGGSSAAAQWLALRVGLRFFGTRFMKKKIPLAGIILFRTRMLEEGNICLP